MLLFRRVSFVCRSGCYLLFPSSSAFFSFAYLLLRLTLFPYCLLSFRSLLQSRSFASTRFATRSFFLPSLLCFLCFTCLPIFAFVTPLSRPSLRLFSMLPLSRCLLCHRSFTVPHEHNSQDQDASDSNSLSDSLCIA